MSIDQLPLSLFAPFRLVGLLAAAAVIAISTAAFETVMLASGATNLRIRFQITQAAENATINVHAILADNVTRSGIILATAAVGASATEQLLDVALLGERRVEVEIVENGGLNAITVDFVELTIS